jgi:UDP-N-acetylglucosamine 1-carboxyvinyltransferase
MARIIIQGGRRLSGEFTPRGNKNGALPMLAACVLTDEPVCLQNIPLIDDVCCMLELLADLGVAVDQHGHTVTLCAKGIRKRRLNAELCRKVRTSILLAGPMTARHGKVTIYPPGGDVIGRRRLDTHFDGLDQLGIRCRGGNSHQFTRQTLRGARVLLDEASVTATENILMAAVLAEGETSIYNAACEPHVQDLCHLLNKMGAGIRGIGTNLLRVRGVATLHGTRHRIAPDYINAASYLAAAVLTGGHLTLNNCPREPFEIVQRHFSKMGVKFQWTGNDTLDVPSGQRLVIRNDFGAAIPKIEDGIWPAFPSDLMSVAIVLATQARGSMLFFEKLFESRMYFVDRLIAMGARIVQCDPHRVMVSGPARLHGTHLVSPDIRAGMALVLAALCAKGESIIDNAEMIDRGYEEVERDLRRLGAEIERQP